MRKSPRGPENLIAAVEFYISRELGDEKISSPQHDFTIPED